MGRFNVPLSERCFGASLIGSEGSDYDIAPNFAIRSRRSSLTSWRSARGMPAGHPRAPGQQLCLRELRRSHPNHKQVSPSGFSFTI